jgi:hypothetical protein
MRYHSVSIAVRPCFLALILACPLLVGCAICIDDPANVEDLDSGCSARIRAGTLEAEDLIRIIRRVQKQNIRESTGEYDFECFTDRDYARFVQSGKPLQIVRNLKRSQCFLAVIEKVKALPEGERKQLLQSAREVCHPTWGELGRIAKDGSGQTWAGQKAELLLAGAIVDVAQGLLGVSSP